MFSNILRRLGKSDKKRENSGKSIPLYPVFFKSRHSILLFSNSFIKKVKIFHKKG